MSAILAQIVQIFLVVALAPMITGWVRLVKARLQGRIGASALQPYRDIYRLLQKEAMVAHSASWVFRAAPYVTFTAVWLAAAIIPTFTTNLFLAPAADLSAVKVRALSAGTCQDLGPAEFRVEGGRLVLAIGKPGAGRYVITW